MTKIIPTKLHWSYNNERYVTSLEELESTFEQLEQEAQADEFPFFVEVLLEDGSEEGLYLMVGYDYSILQYFSSSSLRLMRTATGNPLDAEIYVPSSFMGSYTEPSRSRMIPAEQAYEALREFVLYKRILRNIKFE